MVFNATFNNISVISWRSILLVEETGGPGEKDRHYNGHKKKNGSTNNHVINTAQKTKDLATQTP
jgi:hypothetical protein